MALRVPRAASGSSASSPHKYVTILKTRPVLSDDDNDDDSSKFARKAGRLRQFSLNEYQNKEFVHLARNINPSIRFSNIFAF
jgi:hypothetical protein